MRVESKENQKVRRITRIDSVDDSKAESKVKKKGLKEERKKRAASSKIIKKQKSKVLMTSQKACSAWTTMLTYFLCSLSPSVEIESDCWSSNICSSC